MNGSGDAPTMTNHDTIMDDDRLLPDGLARPARRALTSAGVIRLRDLTTFPEAEIRHMQGMGPKALERLQRALSEIGWTFADG